MVKALNDYLHLRQERGELKKKKLNISIYDPIMSIPCYDFSQDSEEYSITLSGNKTLEQMMVYVDQFSKVGFTTSEIYRPYGVASSEEAERMNEAFEKREKELDEIKLPAEDIKAIKQKKQTLWKKNGMTVTYQNDKINCYLGNKKIRAQSFSFPLVIQDRFIVQNAFQLDVYNQDTELLESYEYSDADSFDYSGFLEAEVYDKWINFMNSYEPILGYSYDKNRFYKIERK